MSAMRSSRLLLKGTLGMLGPLELFFLPWANIRVAASRPVSRSRPVMLLTSSAIAAPARAASAAAGEHAGHQLECLPGLALLVGLEQRIDLRERVGLDAGHLRANHGVAIERF